MDQVAERKFRVLKRLDKEMESLKALQDLGNRSSTTAGGMVTILDSFEHRLAKLETTILPVYQQTGNLQRRHHNIEKTLSALDHVLSFYNAAGETEAIIRSGRPSESRGGVASYLRAMDQLAAACHYFRSHNPQSVELSNVCTLFDAGSEALGREFRDELKKYQRPLNPIVTLDLIALEGDELSEEALSSIELIPAAARDDLALIAAWLDKHSHSDKLTVYAKIRSQTMMQSLQALRDHQRNNSAERGGIRGLASGMPAGLTSLTPSSMVGNSPAPTLRSRLASNKVDFTPKSRSHKLTNMLERRTMQMLQRAKGRSAGLLSTSGTPTSPFSPYSPASPFSAGGSASPSLAATAEETLEDSDVLLYFAQVSAVVRLGALEQRQLEALVPPQRHVSTLETLLREPIDQLAAQGEHVSSCGLKSMQRGDSSAVMCLLTLLRHLNACLPEYERLLQNCHASLLAKYTAIATSMRLNVSFKWCPMTHSAAAGGGNTLFFVQQLQVGEYTSALGCILLEDASLRATASVQVPGPGEQLSFEQCSALLAAYIKRVLSNLGLSIVQRSEAYSDVTLRAVFRLNNYNYLLSTLMSTGLMATLELVESHAKQHYRDQILQQKKLYSQSWSAVLHHLCPAEELPAAQLTAGKIRDRDRQILKDRFSGFNKEIEEMQRVQRSYSIPDRQLRESLKRDNKEYILPKYQTFYDRYSGVPFSRNTEKYVKYTPAEVANLMDKFFDVAA
ncbi:exocyst complex component 7 [Hyalella azteca]|uniref:Exocyst complex component 7 n=2 Tax=Hyalella azteca TaxID=294128 RepID=A0A979FKR3_HYAAZ|nr:exocyst complex component 7 [Hyalella azteca]